MNLLRTLAIGWLMHLKMASRSALDSILMVIWPLFFATTVFLIARLAGDRDLVIFTSIGSCVMGVWSATVSVASILLQRERWNQTLELLVVTPAGLSSVLAAMCAAVSTIACYSLAATMIWEVAVLGVDLGQASNVPALAVSLVLLLASVGAFSFCLAIVAIRYRAAHSLGNAMEYPGWLLAGMIVPTAVLPLVFQKVSAILPVTWGLNAVRASLRGEWSGQDLLMCTLLVAAYVILGLALARQMIRSARANATLALS